MNTRNNISTIYSQTILFRDDRNFLEGLPRAGRNCPGTEKGFPDVRQRYHEVPSLCLQGSYQDTGHEEQQRMGQIDDSMYFLVRVPDWIQIDSDELHRADTSRSITN